MDRRYCWAVFVAVLLACVISGCGGGSNSSSSSTTTTPTGPLATNVTGLATGTVGTPYYVTFTESGGTAPYTWSQTSGGAMPGGLTFTSQGILTGTPTTAGNFGPYVFTVTDTTGATASTGSLSLTINALTLSVVTASLPNGTVGAAYSFALAATGGSGPYTWSETSGGSLPPGLSVSSAGVISGTPTAGGTYGPYVFTVTDTNNKTAASAGLSISINGTSASFCVPGGNEAALGFATTPYAFLVKGSDANGNPIDIAGSFTPNGSGGLTNAAVDYNGFTNGHEQLQVNVPASSYAFSSDGQGCLSLSFSGLVLASQASAKAAAAVSSLQVADPGSLRMARPAVSASVVSYVQFSFVLTGALQSGRIIESDTATTGTYASGLLHAQTPFAFSLASLLTNFAFGADGWTATTAPGVLRTAIAGTFVNTSGALSSGYADVNVGGTVSGEVTGGQGILNSSIDASSGRGTGSYFLSTSHGPLLTLDFVFYILNGSDVILLTTDTPQNNVSSPLLAGRALAANASYTSSALNGYYLLASQGLAVAASTTGNFAQIGTLNATGTPLSATIYSNNAGMFTNTSYSSVGDTVEASGRVSFTGLTTSPPVAYLTVGSAADEGIAGFLVGTDTAASSGVLVFQSASTSTPAYTDASLSSVGAYAASTAEDVDRDNGAYLGLFNFNGAGGYSVPFSQVSGKVPNSPNLGAYTVTADGSGNLDGGNYPLVTNGQTIFAIPDSGDPLLFIFTNGLP
jgi:hypothetical protein